MVKTLSRTKITHMVLVIMLLVLTVFLGGCKKDKTGAESEKEPNKENVETESLLSFDSYQEITGTSIRLGNRIGETKINKDKQFITEGKGSWMVKPDGDYGKPDVYPYFQMLCIDTSFKKYDFNAYDKVLLDVYNESEEEVQIQWSFTVINLLDEEVSTEYVTYTLSPNDWTTCEYELTDETYSQFLRLNRVKYMTVTFLTKRDAKDDHVPKLYLDNLRGHFSEEERKLEDIEFDFDDGISFENEFEQYLFVTDNSTSNKMTLSRVAYEDIAVNPKDEENGQYALMGDATGTPWPAFTVNFGKQYPKDTVLSFKMYVEVDKALAQGDTYTVESKTQKGGYANEILTKACKFNQWVTINIRLTEESTRAWAFANFDSGNATSKFGDNPVRIYYDDFRIYENVDALNAIYTTVNEDGSVVIRNGFNNERATYTFNKPIKKGQTVSFDIDITPAQHIAVWLLGDDMWESEYYACDYPTWTEKTNIEVKIPEDNEKFTIIVQFRDTTLDDFSNNVVTISNMLFENRTKPAHYDLSTGISFEKPAELYIFEGGIGNNKLKLKRTAYADISVKPKDASCGKYVMSGDATSGIWPAFTIDYGKTYKKGNILTFLMYIEADEQVVDGKTYWMESYTENKGTKNTLLSKNYKFNQWVQVCIQLGEDTDTGWVFANFDGGNRKSILGDAKVRFYFDNFKICESEEELRQTVNTDGSIVITNPLGRDRATYTFNKAVKKGDAVSFDLNVTPSQNVSVWLLGDDMWEDEYFAQNFKTWPKKETITVTVPEDTDHFTIIVKFMDETVDRYNNVVTFSNVSVIDRQKPKDYDLSKGITFENAAELNIFEGGYIKNSLVLSRKAYADVPIKAADDSFGKYVMVGDATSAIWPAFTIDYGKTYEAGNVLSFMMYVEADENLTEGKSCRLEAYTKQGGTKNKPLKSGYEYNKWVQVYIQLNESADSGWIFANFDDGEGGSIFGDENVRIYMDNFKIMSVSGLQQTIDEETGDITVHTDWVGVTYRGGNKYDVDYAWNVSVKAGETIKFTVDECDAPGKGENNGAFFIFVNGKEVAAASWKDANDKVITYTVPDDAESVESITVRNRYYQGENAVSDFMIKDIEISVFEPYDFDFYEGITFERVEDLQLFTKQDNENAHKVDFSLSNYAKEGIPTVEGLGASGLKGVIGSSAKYPGFYINYGESIPAGTGLSFMVYVKADSTTATYSMWGNNIADYRPEYVLNQWCEIRFTNTTATDSQLLWFNFNTAEWTNSLLADGVTVYFDNFKLISDPRHTIDAETGDITVHTDWMKGYANGSNYDIDYTWNVSLKAGDTITFTVDECDAPGNGEKKGAFFFYVNGAEKAAAAWTDNKTLSYTVPKGTTVNSVMLKSRYYNGVAGISDFMIKDIEISVSEPYDVDFYEGITFEYAEDLQLFAKQDEEVAHQIDFSLATYAEEGIPTIEGLGMRGLKGVVGSSAKYPGFYINYGESIPAGTGLSFMVYVKADSTTATYSMWGNNIADYRSEYVLNQWCEIRFTNTTATESQLLWFNFNTAEWTNGLLADGVTVYFDNFKLISNPQQTIDAETGDITVHTDWMKITYRGADKYDIDYIWNILLTEGDKITFTVDECEALGKGTSAGGAFFVFVNGNEVGATAWHQNKTLTYTVPVGTGSIQSITIRNRYKKGEEAVSDFKIKDIVIEEGE